MITIQAAALEALISAIFQAAGSEQAEADLVADSLVKANLMGHDSHGAGLVPAYVQNIKDGTLVPNTAAECIRDDGAIMMFDGKLGFGRRVGGEATDAAIKRCQDTGLSLMTLKHAHHIGRVGAYAEQALDAGLLSMHFVSVTNLPPLVAPWGGAEARFGTNPVCIGVPATDTQPPVLLDMATSIVAMGKVRVAMTGGHEMKEGYLIDAEGQPATDPNVIFHEPHGAIMPFGLHKGYGLCLIAELLGGVYSGAGTIQPENARSGAITNNMFSIFVDPGRLVEDNWIKSEVDATLEYVKGARAADAEAPVLVAGDPERLSSKKRGADGIPLDDTAWGMILEAGRTAGVSEAELNGLVASVQRTSSATRPD